MRQIARLTRKACDTARVQSLAPSVARRPRNWEASYVMDDPAVLREFWTQPEPEGTVPASYIDQIPRSEALAGLIHDLPGDATILEVGCNVGRNLAYLHDHGWPNVAGVEISPHAVELLRETYPQLADRPIHLGPAEQVLPTLSESYDLVFTMAVLEHIHPSSVVVFDEIARLGRRLVCIEPRTDHVSHRQFPHDIIAIFTERGFRCVNETPMADLLTNDMGTYYAWQFDRAQPDATGRPAPSGQPGRNQ